MTTMAGERKSLTMALTDLVVALADALGLGSLIDTAHRWVCARTGEGHSYSVSLLASDDEDTYVLDPLATCNKCGNAMSEGTYLKLVNGYKSLHESAFEEDELW